MNAAENDKTPDRLAALRQWVRVFRRGDAFCDPEDAVGLSYEAYTDWVLSFSVPALPAKYVPPWCKPEFGYECDHAPDDGCWQESRRERIALGMSNAQWVALIGPAVEGMAK